MRTGLVSDLFEVPYTIPQFYLKSRNRILEMFLQTPIEAKFPLCFPCDSARLSLKPFMLSSG